MEKRKSISPLKVYSFPEQLHIESILGLYVIVSPLTANWIVLENEEQLNFFKLLQTNNLETALKSFKGNQKDAHAVVIQIEAKQFEKKDVRPANYSGVMQFHLTNACNMKCPHCYMYAGKKKEKELTTEEIYKVIDLFKESGGEQITFTGGEVCMRTDLLDIIKHTHSSGLNVEVLTNGTLWKEEDIKAVSPYLSRIQISIDGINEEENSKIRGKDNFEKALNTVDTFLSYGVPTDIGITPWFDKTLKNKIQGYATFGKELIEKYKDKPFGIRFTTSLLDGREIKFSSQEKQEYETITESIYKSCMGEDVLDLAFIDFHTHFLLEDNCEFGNLTIESNGNVYFCPSLSMLPTSLNIRRNSFEEILSFSKEASRISCVDNLIPCRNCDLRYICGGGCRIQYFKDFQQEEAFKIVNHPRRKCTAEYKQSIYKQMIRTNEALFQ